MAHLGQWPIDSYVPIPICCHRFSTGAAYAPSSLTYSIYEDATTTGIDEDVAITVGSPFDSIVGFYYVRRQLTVAAGFEVGKNYIVVIKATVDSIAAIQSHTFQVIAQYASSFKKSTAFSNYTFVMYDSADHRTPKAGLAGTMLCERSIDGAAFGTCSNSASEIGTTGVYKLNLSTTDMAGDVVCFRFSATGADTWHFVIFPQAV